MAHSAKKMSKKTHKFKQYSIKGDGFMYIVYKQLEKYRTEKKVVRVAKYGRCSSDEQKKNGYTISDQLSLMDDFCNEYELAGAGNYIDEGISATLEISKRKALAQLIKDAKAGKFDIVIFKCIDRFFRNVGEYYECQKQLRKAGVTWISIEESDLDPDDDDAAFKINIYLTMAEYEAKKTSKRIKFNNKNRIKNKQVVVGQQCFHFPWIVAGEKKNRHLEQNPEKTHILMDLLEYFETHQTKAGTLKHINLKYDMNMSINTLTSLLTDTLLYGEYKGVTGYVEPFITKERFLNIQRILKRNARYSEVHDRVFLFSGLIKCPSCGRNLVGNYLKGKDIYHYRCNMHRVERTCPNSAVLNEKKLEKQLLDNLEQYITSEIVKIESIDESAPVPSKKKDADKIKKEIDRLNTMFRKGRIEEEEYDVEYMKLEKVLKELEVVEEPKPKNLEGLKSLLETDYMNLYAKLDKAHKKAFWRSIIKHFTIDTNKRIVTESIEFF